MTKEEKAEYSRKYNRDIWYPKNKENQKVRTKRSRIKRREAMRTLLIEMKSKPCTDCQEKYPHYVMDFDHVHGSKRFAIGSMTARLVSRVNLLLELVKCELVCANCHRERTFQRARKSIG